MPELKQFNFKMSQDLYNKLNATAKAKGVKMTDLIIQGIQQVLGVAAMSSSFGADLDIYQLIDKITVRLDALEKNHAGTAMKVHQLLPQLESKLDQLNVNTLPANIAKNISDNIYNKVIENLQKNKKEAVYVDETTENSENTEDRLSIDSSIDNSTNNQDNEILEPKISNTAKKDSLENSAQLELIDLISDEKSLQVSAKKIDSGEMLKILQTQEPKGRWDKNLLVKYRTIKRYQDKWHHAGNCYFKYAGQEKEKGSKLNKHFWLINYSNHIQ